MYDILRLELNCIRVDLTIEKEVFKMATLRGLNCCAVFFQKLNNKYDLLGAFNVIDVFDKVRPVHPNGIPYIDFCIMIILSGLFSKSDTITDSDFQRGHTYDVLIRLNHVLSRQGIDVARFSFSTNDIKNDYMYEHYIFKISDMELPCGAGDYSVRIFIKEHEDTTWFLQNEQHFLVTRL